MEKPKVSIIVPVYNVERWLDRCVQSLIHQTLKDIEIILVDDKSPDDCPRICDTYMRMDKRIKVIHRQENGGLGYTRNSGLDVATGKYVAFVDSDDYMDYCAYERLYNECEANNLEICYFRYRRVDESGNYYEMCHEKVIYDFQNRKEVKDVLLAMLGLVPTASDIGRQMKLSVSVCLALYRRDIIDKVRFISERDMASEDLVFHVALLPRINRVRILPDVYYNYFVNSGSISNSYGEQTFRRFIRLLEYLGQTLPEIFNKEEYYEYYLSYVLSTMKVILRFEVWKDSSIGTRCERIKEICSMDLCQPLYHSAFTKHCSFKDRLIVDCMKYRIPLFFIFLYKVMYHKYGVSK